ncbi:Class-10 pathogenesis-related protein 1 [Spatholobus suberectus]|nr:Class-10 pathogenesis-related protein 1 [Spatholobus suberectus]
MVKACLTWFKESILPVLYFGSKEYDTPAVMPPTRLFKAMTLDFHNLFPKLVDGIHSIVFTEGSGGPSTIKKLSTIEG